MVPDETRTVVAVCSGLMGIGGVAASVHAAVTRVGAEIVFGVDILQHTRIIDFDDPGAMALQKCEGATVTGKLCESRPMCGAKHDWMPAATSIAWRHDAVGIVARPVNQGPDGVGLNRGHVAQCNHQRRWRTAFGDSSHAVGNGMPHTELRRVGGQGLTAFGLQQGKKLGLVQRQDREHACASCNEVSCRLDRHGCARIDGEELVAVTAGIKSAAAPTCEQESDCARFGHGGRLRSARHIDDQASSHLASQYLGRCGRRRLEPDFARHCIEF